MKNVPEKHGRQSKVFCIILLVVSLLLTGCIHAPSEPDDPKPADALTGTQLPDNIESSQTPESLQGAGNNPSSDDSADASLVSLRQAMVETPQLFAVAYFGYAAQESSDPFALMGEAAPQLCEDLPFLLAIREENIIGAGGFLFCIVPADENATVAVNRRLWNVETEAYEEPEVLYRSESGNPILVMCPNDNWMPDTEVVITDSKGNVTVWYPHIDSSYSVAPLCDDTGTSLLFDFTSYEELPNPGWDQGTDSAELIGTWELAWTEVEGDRNEAMPGVCTIEITPDETGSFRFTYTDRDFPDWNIRDRELLVVPGELYPGCSNDQWIGEVSEENGDAVHYALTLLEDGTLLLQTYWEMDGMPWVSYGWYRRIS